VTLGGVAGHTHLGCGGGAIHNPERKQLSSSASAPSTSSLGPLRSETRFEDLSISQIWAPNPRSHAERRRSMMGPTQSRISPSILLYFKD